MPGHHDEVCFVKPSSQYCAASKCLKQPQKKYKFNKILNSLTGLTQLIRHIYWGASRLTTTIDCGVL